MCACREADREGQTGPLSRAQGECGPHYNVCIEKWALSDEFYPWAWQQLSAALCACFSAYQQASVEKTGNSQSWCLFKNSSVIAAVLFIFAASGLR